jgi:hypothetical protein
VKAARVLTQKPIRPRNRFADEDFPLTILDYYKRPLSADCDLSTMQGFEAPWQPSAAIADRNDPQRLSR